VSTTEYSNTRQDTPVVSTQATKTSTGTALTKKQAGNKKREVTVNRTVITNKSITVITTAMIDKAFQ